MFLDAISSDQTSPLAHTNTPHMDTRKEPSHDCPWSGQDPFIYTTWLQWRARGRCARCKLVPWFSMPTYSRYIFATRALDVRQVCAGYSLHLSRRTYSEYPASVLRVSGVGPARSACVWRPSGVCTHASSSAHSFEHAQKVRRTQRMTTNRYRRPSVLDERATSTDAHPANDSALAKMNGFFVRWPCVV